MLTHRGYAAQLTVDPEDDVIHGRVLGIDDVVVFEGNTPVEAARAFRDSVDDYLEHCAEVGRPPEPPYSGEVRVRLRPEQHRALAEAAASAHLSLDAYIVNRLTAGLAPPVGP